MRIRRTASLTLAIAILTACGGDSNGPSGVKLTQQQSLQIFGLATQAIGQALAGITPSIRAASLRRDPFSGSGSHSIDCEVSGSATADLDYLGSFDSQGGSFQYDFDMAFSFDHCTVNTSGGVVVINTDPALVVTGDYDYSSAGYSYGYGEHGTLLFATQQGSGSCSIGYDYSVAWDGQSATSSSGGTICGYSLGSGTSVTSASP